jgi:hypothetical protein
MIQMVKSDPTTLNSTIQCLFFGVPTQGMNVDTLFPIVQNQHNAVTLFAFMKLKSLPLQSGYVIVLCIILVDMNRITVFPGKWEMEDEGQYCRVSE